MSGNRANASNDCSFNNNTNNINNDTEEEEEEILSLKFESINSDNDKEEEEEDEEKETESSNDLRFTPLAVPMIADSLQQSITRNDAKIITQTRLKRLKELSERPEYQLSKHQKDEKKRIIRLEKNRRAAAMSRRKKKIYVKSLEEKHQLMTRHLAILQMENSHLRALIAATTQHHQQQQHPFKIATQHFQIPSIPHFMSSNNNNNNSSLSSNTATTNSSSNTINNTIEPNTENNRNTAEPPSLKRRKLNDGTSLNTITSSPSCDNSSDISILEPLPLPLPVSSTNSNNDNNNKELFIPPPVPIQFMSVAQSHLLLPNIANIHPSRLISYPPPHPIPSHHNISHELAPNVPRIHAHILNGEIIHSQHNDIDHNEHLLPKIIIDDDDNHQNINENGEKKSVEIEERNNNYNYNDNYNDDDDDNDMSSEIAVPRLSNEYLFILDDDIIDETVDECGSVIAFQQESKVKNVYL